VIGGNPDGGVRAKKNPPGSSFPWFFHPPSSQFKDFERLLIWFGANSSSARNIALAASLLSGPTNSR
jgi:hypothetical protein